MNFFHNLSLNSLFIQIGIFMFFSSLVTFLINQSLWTILSGSMGGWLFLLSIQKVPEYISMLLQQYKDKRINHES